MNKEKNTSSEELISFDDKSDNEMIIEWLEHLEIEPPKSEDPQ